MEIITLNFKGKIMKNTIIIAENEKNNVKNIKDTIIELGVVTELTLGGWGTAYETGNRSFGLDI